MRLTFTSTDRRQRQSLQLVQSIELDAAPNSRWLSEISGRTRAAAGYVTVDSNGDGQPNALLPGTSPSFFADSQTGSTSSSESITCHAGSGHLHCYYDCGAPPGGYCP